MGMKVNDIASSFQSGAADLAGTAIVVRDGQRNPSRLRWIRCVCSFSFEYDFAWNRDGIDRCASCHWRLGDVYLPKVCSTWLLHQIQDKQL